MHDYQVDVARDSVCVRDDARAPNAYSFRISTQATLNDVFEHLVSQSYLASVAGKNHSWEAFINDHCVAFFKGSNRKPEFSDVLSDEISKYIIDDKLIIYFIYKSAKD